MKIQKMLVPILSLTVLLSTNKPSFSESNNKNFNAVKKNISTKYPNLKTKTVDLIVGENKEGHVFSFKELSKLAPFLEKTYFDPVSEIKSQINQFNEDNYSLSKCVFSGIKLASFAALGLAVCYLNSLLFTRGIIIHISNSFKDGVFKIEHNSPAHKKVLQAILTSLLAFSGFKSKYDLLMKKKEEKLCKLQSLTEKLAQATARKNNCLDSVRVFLDELKLIIKESNTHLLEKIISDSDCIAYKHEGPEEGGCCSIYFKKPKTKNIKLTEEDKDTLRQNFNKLAKDLENLLNEEM